MSYEFRKATLQDAEQVWNILKSAIARRKADGSEQWQDGYPNMQVAESDIQKGVGYVLTDGETIQGYTAILINDEPAYAGIKGNWLTNDDFVVFHRVAIAEEYIGKGLAKKMLQFIETFAIANNIYSIKADTNFDNTAMLKTFDKMGYAYCGEVWFRGNPRRAYEKVLVKK